MFQFMPTLRLRSVLCYIHENVTPVLGDSHFPFVHLHVKALGISAFRLEQILRVMEAMVPAFLAPILSGRGLDVYQAVVPMATANESETVTFSVGFLASPSTPGFWPVRAGEPWMKTVGWMGFVPVTDPESQEACALPSGSGPMPVSCGKQQNLLLSFSDRRDHLIVVDVENERQQRIAVLLLQDFE
jgi:hypothetical protein